MRAVGGQRRRSGDEAGQEDERTGRRPRARRLTMMFTDIRGSSALWRDAPEAMWHALEAHAAQVRALEAPQGGFLVKSMGDGHLLAFADPTDAVAFALALLRAQQQRGPPSHGAVCVRGVPLEMRVGMADGPVFSRVDTIQDGTRVRDFVGPTVNTASRMESRVAVPGGLALAVCGPLTARIQRALGQLRTAPEWQVRALHYTNLHGPDATAGPERADVALLDGVADVLVFTATPCRRRPSPRP